MTTGLFVVSAFAAFVLLFAWALVRAASETPRRGAMARYIRPAERRMRYQFPRGQLREVPTNKGPREAA